MRHLFRSVTFIGTCFSLLTASAQLPATVDIMLIPGGTATRLDVQVYSNNDNPDDDNFSGIVNGLTFTIRWPAASAASVGTAVDACPLAGNIITATAEVTNGGYKYRKYHVSGVQALSQVGCHWVNNDFAKIMSIAVANPGQCTAFSIVNDAFTTSTNGNFYCELNGSNRAGDIAIGSVTLCAVDCLGVLNGTAQPGTPCNDGIACTVNEVLSTACVCTGGISGDFDGDGICDALDLCPETPGQPGSPCDDGIADTYNDVVLGSCNCGGTLGCKLQAKVFLEGPYVPADGRMQDYLRDAGLLPLTEPYTALGYTFIGGGAETAGAGVLTNDNASTSKVDWVIVQLRSATNPATIVTSRSALLCRDGTITDEFGTSPLLLKAPQGSYYVAIRHRNHLGVMSATAFSFAPFVWPAVDFTLTATAVYGTNARKTVSGVQTLWAGDASFNGEVKYTGSGNDRDPILTTVGSTTPNTTVTTYSPRDVNMNGSVRYTGSANDRDPVLVNVGSTTPNNVRVQQLP